MSYETIDLKCRRCGHGQSQHSMAAGGCGVDMMNNANEVCFCTEFQWAPGQRVERPVSPATTAREWLIERLGVTGALGLVYQMLNGERVAEILEAREMSQSEKLVGIGQEAADRFKRIEMSEGCALDSEYLAAIIDQVLAERLAK